MLDVRFLSDFIVSVVLLFCYFSAPPIPPHCRVTVSDSPFFPFYCISRSVPLLFFGISRSVSLVFLAISRSVSFHFIMLNAPFLSNLFCRSSLYISLPDENRFTLILECCGTCKTAFFPASEFPPHNLLHQKGAQRKNHSDAKRYVKKPTP